MDQVPSSPVQASVTSSAAQTVSSVPAEIRRRLATRSAGWPGKADLERVRAITDPQLDDVLSGQDNAVPDNTLRAYKGDWAIWTAWCEQEACPSLPAAPMDVAVFLAEAASMSAAPTEEGKPAKRFVYAVTTLARWASVISTVHDANRLPSPTHDPLVRDTLRGIRADRTRELERPQQKKSAVLAVMTTLLAQRSAPGWPGTVPRRRDKFLLLSGYAGALRRSEASATTLDDIVLDHDADSGGEPTLRVLLGPTKAGRTEVVEQVMLPKEPRAATCPVCAYAAWVKLLEVNAHGGFAALRAYVKRLSVEDELALDVIHRCDRFAGTDLADGSGRPVFPRIWPQGKIGDEPMTGWSMNDMVKRYAERAGEDPAEFGFQSLRAGGDQQRSRRRKRA